MARVMSPAERTAVERGIAAARVVVASDGAAECRRLNGDKLGVWTTDDEKRLRAGVMRTPGGDLYLPIRGFTRFGEDK